MVAACAGLTCRLLHLAQAGAEAADDGWEAVALGRMYWRGGLESKAVDAYLRALAMVDGSGRRAASIAGNAASIAGSAASIAGSAASIAALRIDALRSLALLARRARCFEESASYWRRLLDASGCPPHIAREATQALAIHHEHRIRDFAAARAFALRSLDADPHPAWADAVRHRVARIQRKMEQASSLGLQLLADSNVES